MFVLCTQDAVLIPGPHIFQWTYSIVCWKIGKQILVTSTTQRTDNIVWDSTKDFYLCVDDESVTGVEVKLCDGRTVLGVVVIS